jgi:hypothetical protein
MLFLIFLHTIQARKYLKTIAQPGQKMIDIAEKLEDKVCKHVCACVCLRESVKRKICVHVYVQMHMYAHTVSVCVFILHKLREK